MNINLLGIINYFVTKTIVINDESFFSIAKIYLIENNDLAFELTFCLFLHVLFPNLGLAHIHTDGKTELTP